MAHSDSCYVLHNNKGPESPHASRSCLSRNRLNSDGCETRRTTFLRAHHHAHAEHVHHSHHHVVDKSYRAHRGSPFLKACGNYSAAVFLCQPFFQKAFFRRRAGAGKRRAMRAKSAAAQGRKRRRILFSAHGMTPLGRETTGKNPPGNPGGKKYKISITEAFPDNPQCGARYRARRRPRRKWKCRKRPPGT